MKADHTQLFLAAELVAEALLKLREHGACPVTCAALALGIATSGDVLDESERRFAGAAWRFLRDDEDRSEVSDQFLELL